MLLRRLSWLLGLLLAPVPGALAAERTFTLLVHNVENLFDADGVAVYDEYHPGRYTAAHLRTKLDGVVRIVRAVDGGKGPDVVLLQEIELDRTPDREPSAVQHLLGALEEAGLRGYTAVEGGDSIDVPHEDGNPRAIQCVVLTRFPVRAVRRHPTVNSRNILEVEVDVHGAPLYVFNNHWKSGASDPATELIRIENARTLRTRIDRILEKDPQADIVLGGDFNSQYNQSRRYADTMKVTGLNDILKSQGNELALRGPQRDLYNLWFEVPPDERGSDVFRGEWGTLMQLIVSRGLYDYRGVQYVDNSFRVLKLPGVNATPEGLPARWSNDGPAGSGASDHFPLLARFRVVPDNRPDKWTALQNPSSSDESPVRPPRAPERQVDLSKAVRLSDLGGDSARLRDGTWGGKPVRVEARVAAGQRIAVEFGGLPWEVWIPDAVLRRRVRERWKEGDPVAFYGLVSQFRGVWQFTVEREDWLK